ncbi:hypothetical protein RU639_013135 [Aspergillus parasiticus]|uniref:NUDIX hydrolase domain-like protein n=1 Tax=Aspergillus transmontanensis TaxID=1034304 RepID=A0A5N6VK23_9EURO|nr:NUDIX hydrolase domain-like protein [Aspergillus transmontanensis]
MEVSRLERVTLDTNLSPFHIARHPGYKFLLEGLICSLRVNVIILDKYAPACSMLLLQCSARDGHSGCWKLPGGKVDYNDKTLREAAKREVEKKTGITRFEFLDTVPTKTRDSSKNEGVHQWLGFTFLATVDGQSGWLESIRSAEEEHRVLKWVTKSDVLRMEKTVFYGNHLETILGTFDIVENVINLSQRGSSTATHHGLGSLNGTSTYTD